MMLCGWDREVLHKETRGTLSGANASILMNISIINDLVVNAQVPLFLSRQ